MRHVVRWDAWSSVGDCKYGPGFPVFGGAIALVFGALVVGSEYGWGTLKTVFVQHPGRLQVTSGTLLALALMQIAFVLAVFLPGVMCSFVVASVENTPVVWPSALDFAQGLGAAWLILTMWGMLGALLAALLRGATLAIGLGVFYLLIERLLAGFANLSDIVSAVSKALPGTNAGSLTAALAPSSTTPGVAAAVGTTQALLVMVDYLAAFVLVGIAPVLRRDVT
jgi:ABC-2 type transport system permease protein